MRIDSHQHFWKLARGDYNWLTPDFGVLYQDYMPEDLLENLRKHQIDKTILVQAADSIEETYYMFDLMENYDFIAGVVGWLDFEAEDFRKQLLEMMKVDGFVGVRPMIQDIEDDNWVLREQVVNNIKVLHELQIPLDILIFPRHLKVIKQLLEIIPNLKCVIDHLAKPQIKDKNYDSWSKEIATLANYPNVYCKISGLITEADHQHWKAEDCRQYIMHCIHVFTEERIMYGSDWPVCLLAGSYTDVYETADSVVQEVLDESGKKKFYGKNAEDFYSRIRRDS